MHRFHLSFSYIQAAPQVSLSQHIQVVKLEKGGLQMQNLVAFTPTDFFSIFLLSLLFAFSICHLLSLLWYLHCDLQWGKSRKLCPRLRGWLISSLQKALWILNKKDEALVRAQCDAVCYGKFDTQICNVWQLAVLQSPYLTLKMLLNVLLHFQPLLCHTCSLLAAYTCP